MENCIWDYRDPYEWMTRVSKSTLPPVMISCAITGGIQGKEYNMNIPETIDEQVEAVYEAYQEGAVSAHIHVRNPDNVTQGSSNKDDYSRINELVRKRCPGMIVNNSTGGGPELTIEQKMACLFAETKPDLASLNPGPFMLKVVMKERKAPLIPPRPEVRGDIVIPITYSDVDKTVELMNEKGIKPEIELFHSGQFHVINDLIKQQMLTPPYLIQLVFGFQTSVYPTPANVLSLINELPGNSIYFCPGIGAFQLPMNVMSLITGGHVRVGLEDNVYYRKGELSISSAQQVARIRRIAEEMNRPVATTAQAREMIGLPPA